MSNGVNISLREIFDTLQGVATDVRNLGSRMDKFEEETTKLANLRRDLDSTTEQARQAYLMADSLRKEKEDMSWMKKAVISAVIVTVVTASVGFMLHAVGSAFKEEIRIENKN